MSSPERIWIIDDDRSIRWVLERALRQADMDVESFESAAGVLDALVRNPPDAIVTDVRMPGMNGMELLERIQAQQPDLPVIIMTAHSDLSSAVSAYQGGAFEYLPKPFDIDEAVAVVRRAVAQRRTGRGGAGPAPAPPDAEIIGEAPAMQEVFRAIGRLSRSKITVLINGESGTDRKRVV